MPPFGQMAGMQFEAGQARSLSDGTVVDVRMFGRNGVALRVVRGGRAFLVVRDTVSLGSETHAAMVGLMPGLSGALPEMFSGAGVGVYANVEDLGDEGAAAWVARREEVASAGIDVLLGVVADPSGWAGGVFDPGSAAGAVGVLGWASTGLTSGTRAARFVGAGVAPGPYAEWVASGWSEDDLLEWLPNSDWSPVEAAVYRDAGLSHGEAGVWFRNANGLHGRTAAGLAGAGWSATGAARVVRALESAVKGLVFASWFPGDECPYPAAGDVLVQEWAGLDGLSAAQVCACVQAGLSAGEVRALLAGGLFDIDRVALMGALRR